MMNILRRFHRAPMQALAVLMLAAVLSASLCGLVKAAQVQQEKYEEMYETIPVYLRVTNLSATRWDDLDCPRWVMDVFTGFGFGKNEESLKDYVKEVYVKMSAEVTDASCGGAPLDNVKEVVGITSPDIVDELSRSKAGIDWLEGYDESMFTMDEPLCIVSASLLPEDWDGVSSVELIVTVTCDDGFSPPMTASKALKVVGTHAAGAGFVYTGFETMRDIYSSVGMSMSLDSVTAVLKDNDRQEELRQAAFVRFAEPNATGEHTKWRWAQYFWYPYALEIDNSLLESAEMTLKTSLLLGELCSYLLFILSAGAGFFVGFLMIRGRKREIALMRSMGRGGTAIFAELVLEQLLCLLAGTILGGAAFLWQPVERLAVFVLVYALGLSIALVVFLNRNLMQALKEDE